MSAPPLSPKLMAEAMRLCAEHGGNVGAAARASGLPYSTLSSRIQRAQQCAQRHAKQDAPMDTGVHHQKLAHAARHSVFVFTCAQNATSPHPVFQTLLRYCDYRRAHLVVIPLRYHNPTSLWGDEARSDDWWHHDIAPYLLDQRFNLNKHLTALADIKTQPTAVNPLAGLETITGSRSAIVGHPRIEMLTIPTPQSKLPKMLYSTGCVTRKNYVSAKAGKKAEFHHSYGALVVERDGDLFFPRQLNATPDGCFYDLDYYYTPRGRRRAPRAAALVMGDSHIEFIDPAVVEATFGSRGIVRTLRPEALVWHDAHDFYARNHHHNGRVFTNYAKHLSDMDNVERLLDETFAFIDRHTPRDTRNIFVASNHPDALARWVAETDPKADSKNVLFWAHTFAAMLGNTRMTESGASTVDPFEYWARYKLRCYERSSFLARDQSCRIRNIEVGFHGDQGLNGARGTVRGFTKIGTKSVVGHHHSPAIQGGVYCVGTSSRLHLEYNHGPSSWAHTHCIIYPNGKRTLVTIINGKWRV